MNGYWNAKPFHVKQQAVGGKEVCMWWNKDPLRLNAEWKIPEHTWCISAKDNMRDVLAVQSGLKKCCLRNTCRTRNSRSALCPLHSSEVRSTTSQMGSSSSSSMTTASSSVDELPSSSAPSSMTTASSSVDDLPSRSAEGA